MYHIWHTLQAESSSQTAKAFLLMVLVWFLIQLTTPQSPVNTAQRLGGHFTSPVYLICRFFAHRDTHSMGSQSLCIN